MFERSFSGYEQGGGGVDGGVDRMAFREPSDEAVLARSEHFRPAVTSVGNRINMAVLARLHHAAYGGGATGSAEVKVVKEPTEGRWAPSRDCNPLSAPLLGKRLEQYVYSN